MISLTFTVCLTRKGWVMCFVGGAQLPYPHHLLCIVNIIIILITAVMAKWLEGQTAVLTARVRAPT